MKTVALYYKSEGKWILAAVFNRELEETQNWVDEMKMYFENNGHDVMIRDKDAVEEVAA